MRCLLKLSVAIGLAVLAQTLLLRPGGFGDECAFTARVYVADRFFGISPDSPEMVDAAARLLVRQGHRPEYCLASIPRAIQRPDDDENCADANGQPILAADRERDELACTQ